jgi:hypothetical protein
MSKMIQDKEEQLGLDVVVPVIPVTQEVVVRGSWGLLGKKLTLSENQTKSKRTGAWLKR